MFPLVRTEFPKPQPLQFQFVQNFDMYHNIGIHFLIKANEQGCLEFFTLGNLLSVRTVSAD